MTHLATKVSNITNKLFYNGFNWCESFIIQLLSQEINRLIICKHFTLFFLNKQTFYFMVFFLEVLRSPFWNGFDILDETKCQN